MRSSIIGLAAIAIAAVSSPVLAQDTAPPSAFTISGGAALVSDYRFRGISQTDKRFAVQGTFTVSHSSGFYGTVWGSSIDDYIERNPVTGKNSAQEIDLIAGYKKTISGTTIDGGVLYYYYPGSGGINSDFFEPYFDIAHTFGPITAKATVNYAFKQRAIALNQVSPKEDNVYVAGDFTAAIPKTPVSLSAHIGHTFGPSYLSIGKEYTDWGVGASYTYKQLTFGVQYVDTDGDFITPSGRNASKSGVVGSVGVAF